MSETTPDGMVIYKVPAPDGKTYRVPGPPGATREQIQAELLRQVPDAGKAPDPWYKLGPGASSIVRPLLEAAVATPGAVGDIEQQFFKGLGGEQSWLKEAREGAQGSTAAPAPPAATPAREPPQRVPRRGDKRTPTQGLEQPPPDPSTVSGALQTGINNLTTAPTSPGGKALEFGLSTLAGGIGGPKGKLTSALPAGIRKYLQGPNAEVAKRLIQRRPNMVMTPGERRGGTLNAVEEKLSRAFPPLREARERPGRQLNTDYLNDAMRQFGGAPIPKGLEGFDANRYAYGQIQKRGYDRVLGNAQIRLGGKTAFDQALIDARVFYNGNALGQDSPLADSEIRQLKDMITRRIEGQFTTSGVLRGQTIKDIESLLRTEADKLRGSEDYSKRLLATTLDKIREGFKATIVAQNPQIGPKLDEVDRAYAMYKTAEKASSLSGVKSEGVYTPAQRLAAMKARDKSKDRGLFNRGSMPGQAEARRAEKVLGNKQPESGTPFGTEALAATLGLAGGAAGFMQGNDMTEKTKDALTYGGLLAASPFLYSKPVMRFLQNRAMADKPLLSKLGAALAGRQDLTSPQPSGEEMTQDAARGITPDDPQTRELLGIK